MNRRPDRETLPGMIAVGGVVVLTGAAAKAAADALLIAVRSRRVNGLPRSVQYEQLAAALVSAAGHSDGRDSAAAHHERMTITAATPPTMPVEDAAALLGLSKRQTRRIAAERLGGRIIAGRWLCDAQAVAEMAEDRRRG